MADFTRLHSLIKDMDLPSGRKEDIHWLQRNMAIRNRDHPKYKEAHDELQKHLRNYDNNRLKEDSTQGVPANAVGSGFVQGTGVGTQGEPGVNLRKKKLRDILMTKNPLVRKEIN